jgi:hypothetical protein
MGKQSPGTAASQQGKDGRSHVDYEGEGVREVRQEAKEERCIPIPHRSNRLDTLFSSLLLFYHTQAHFRLFQTVSQTLRVAENTLTKRIEAAHTNLRRVLRDAKGDEAVFLPDHHLPGDW